MSVSVHELPASVKDVKLLVAAAVTQAPRLVLLMQSGQAKAHSVRNEAGECLLGIGGLMEPDVFEKVHGALMAIDGVELVVGAGPGCSTLPRTAFARAAVGAAARAKAARSRWKVR